MIANGSPPCLYLPICTASCMQRCKHTMQGLRLFPPCRLWISYGTLFCLSLAQPSPSLTSFHSSWTAYPTGIVYACQHLVALELKLSAKAVWSSTSSALLPLWFLPMKHHDSCPSKRPDVSNINVKHLSQTRQWTSFKQEIVIHTSVRIVSDGCIAGTVQIMHNYLWQINLSLTALLSRWLMLVSIFSSHYICILLELARWLRDRFFYSTWSSKQDWFLRGFPSCTPYHNTLITTPA